MNLDFKTYDIFKRFITKPYHPKLAQLLSWWGDEFYEIIITSAWRPTGIHSTGRAVDIRSFIYSNPNGIEKYVNSNWTYDPGRPDMKVCLLHRAKKKDGSLGAIHFHLQVHDKSVMNGRDP
jgi:hypothetical protein